MAEVGENSHGKNNLCKIGLLETEKPTSDNETYAAALPNVISDYEIDAGDSSGIGRFLEINLLVAEITGATLRCQRNSGELMSSTRHTCGLRPRSSQTATKFLYRCP
jgi:hypothetical protein